MDTPEEKAVSAGSPDASSVEALQRQLVQARQALEDFTYSVSHDLRAPLRHVVSYLKILREDLPQPVDPAILSHLQTASDAAAQMGRQMDGLLELSRLGRQELQQGDVDLQLLIVETLRGLEPQAAGRRVDWVVATDLPRLHGDIALLGRLLQLLLDNALKFSRARDPAVIRIGWQPVRAGWCALQIQDNGAGFDPRFADRLFKAFQRLHSARQFEGLGMGLALARAVVERHGGRIHAEGRPDAGCTISVELPLAAVGTA